MSPFTCPTGGDEMGTLRTANACPHNHLSSFQTRSWPQWQAPLVTGSVPHPTPGHTLSECQCGLSWLHSNMHMGSEAWDTLSMFEPGVLLASARRRPPQAPQVTAQSGGFAMRCFRASSSARTDLCTSTTRLEPSGAHWRKQEEGGSMQVSLSSRLQSPSIHCPLPQRQSSTSAQDNLPTASDVLPVGCVPVTNAGTMPGVSCNPATTLAANALAPTNQPQHTSETAGAEHRSTENRTRGQDMWVTEATSGWSSRQNRDQSAGPPAHHRWTLLRPCFRGTETCQTRQTMKQTYRWTPAQSEIPSPRTARPKCALGAQSATPLLQCTGMGATVLLGISTNRLQAGPITPKHSMRAIDRQ